MKRITLLLTILPLCTFGNACSDVNKLDQEIQKKTAERAKKEKQCETEIIKKKAEYERELAKLEKDCENKKNKLQNKYKQFL